MKNRFIISRRTLLNLFCSLLIVLHVLPLITSASASDSVCTAARAPSAEADASQDNSLVNILLIGQDRREADSPARADSVILCSFQPEAGSIVITSFLRDLYVEIPGHEGNRLNAAYALGGMSLLKETLQKNFDICIDGCIEADFSCFPQIIDTLGGVSIELRKDEADAINKTIPGTLTDGLHLLNGSQALAYSRIRKLDADGDFSRTNRQRKVLTSLLDSYRNAGLMKMISVAADLLPMVSTDLSKKEIMILAARLYPLVDCPSVVSQRIPADGSYSFGNVRNMDVLIADLEEAGLLLKSTLESAKKVDKS